MLEPEGVRLGYGDAVLSIHAVEPGPPWDGILVVLDAVDLRASRRVELLEASNLSDFFRSLAAQWRGWDGPREWASIEGDLRLVCHHNGVGHVMAEVTLGLVPPHEWHVPGWAATVSVVVDPGALDDFASSLRTMLHGR